MLWKNLPTRRRGGAEAGPFAGRLFVFRDGATLVIWNIQGACVIIVLSCGVQWQLMKQH
jgi:hypothetical protein